MMKPRAGFLLITLLAASATIPHVGNAYTWNGRRWPTGQMTYYVNPANSDVSRAAAVAAVQAAAAVWSTQTNASFSFSYGGETSGSTFAGNGKSEIFFRGSNGGLRAETMRWIDASGYIFDADIAFYDDSVTFYAGTSGCSAGVYIEDTGAHEFGHALGLSHSSLASATMYATAPACDQGVRMLDSDDIAGVEAIYPPTTRNTNTPPMVTIGSPLNGSAFSEGTNVTLSGSASDQQDGTISSRLVWTSSVDGQLGTGSSLTKALSAGSHTITASVADTAGATASSYVSISVTAPTADPPPTPVGVTLTASGSRTKNRKNVALRWGGTASSMIDVYRNGVKATTTANDGSYTDAITTKGGGTFGYQVCEAGATSICSNTATVVF